MLQAASTGIWHVLRIDEQLYGCEELPEGEPVRCDVLLESDDGHRRVLAYPDAELIRLDIWEGSAVRLLADGTLDKVSQQALSKGVCL
ncbi:MAG: hypothetical protein ACI4JC_00020 [Faecalibacterium sp.]